MTASPISRPPSRVRSTDRSAAVTVGGKSYEMILTPRATKEIARRYGGLANPGETLMKSENTTLTK